jgi:predicted  nucleic acid-binding Zn-ribbon protein
VTLLEVQRHDLEVDRARHRRATLPEAVRVTELEAAAKAIDDDITRATVEVSDLEAEQRKADADVDLVRQRSEKDRVLLDTINDAKQLSNLQHELESLARRQAELEDVELEVMERLEAAQKAHAALLAQREALSTELADARTARDNALADLADEEQIARAAREAAAQGLPADLLALYDKLRADNGGIGAAALHRGRCEGCRIELTPVDLGRIREAPPAEVIRCEECRRILVRTAESGL